MTSGATPDECPLCGASMQGEPIPQEYIDAGYYAEGLTHYSKCIGHEVPGVYDGVLFWVDPTCGKAWPRFVGVEAWGRWAFASTAHAEHYNEAVEAAA